MVRDMFRMWVMLLWVLLVLGAVSVFMGAVIEWVW